MSRRAEQIEQCVLDLRMLLRHRVERALFDPERHEWSLGPHVGLTLPLVEQRSLAEDVPLLQADLAARARHDDAGQSGDDGVESERALVPHDDHRAGHELDELRGACERDERVAGERREEAERRHRRVGVVRGLLTQSRRLGTERPRRRSVIVLRLRVDDDHRVVADEVDEQDLDARVGRVHEADLVHHRVVRAREWSGPDGRVRERRRLHARLLQRHERQRLRRERRSVPEELHARASARRRRGAAAASRRPSEASARRPPRPRGSSSPAAAAAFRRGVRTAAAAARPARPSEARPRGDRLAPRRATSRASPSQSRAEGTRGRSSADRRARTRRPPPSSGRRAGTIRRGAATSVAPAARASRAPRAPSRRRAACPSPMPCATPRGALRVGP